MDIIKGGLITGIGIQLMHMVPWEALFAVLQVFGVVYFELNDRETMQRVKPRVPFSTRKSTNGERLGYGCGRWYVCTLPLPPEHHSSTPMYIVGLSRSVEKLMEDGTVIGRSPQAPPNGAPPAATVEAPQHAETTRRISFYRSGSHSSRNVKVTAIKPSAWQQDAMDKILAMWNQRGFAVALIHGPPGAGKSMVAYLLAQHLESIFCNNFAPWKPQNYSLTSAVLMTSPTEAKPLVICVDEIDVAIRSVHAGVVPRDSKDWVEISDKSCWNRMFDDIDRGMFPNVILIMTMNSTLEDIDAIDKAYLRKGRVDLKIAAPRHEHFE